MKTAGPRILSRAGQKKVAKLAESLPLHKFLGVKLKGFREGSGELELKAGKSAVNVAGVLHGGVLDAAAFTESEAWVNGKLIAVARVTKSIVKQGLKK